VAYPRTLPGVCRRDYGHRAHLDIARYGSSVNPEAQWYLVETLARARGNLGIRDDYESKQRTLSHFAGVLAAFRYQDGMTQEEEHDWYRKMLVALGYEAPDLPPPGVAAAIHLGDPEKRPPPPPAEITPTFLRS